MRILLVRTARMKQAITLGSFMFCEPLGLEMVYSVLKHNHEVRILDMMVEDTLAETLAEFRPQAVGITSLCIDVHMVLGAAEKIKQFDANITTFVGGTQSLLSPESFFHPAVDYIFKFTTTQNLIALMSAIESGKAIAQDGILSKAAAYADNGVKGRNEYIFPDRKSTAKYRAHYSYFGYRPAAIMELGTGCAKTCDFCLRWRIEGAREQLIDRAIWVQDLLAIEEETVMFIDNDLFTDDGKVQALIQVLKEHSIKKNLIAYGSVKGILTYREEVEEMAKLGLKALLIGYETFNDAEMEKYRKKSTTDENKQAALLAKSLGIDVWASFMAHPDWTKADFKKFRAYIKALGAEISTINPLTPFPGLPLYEQYRERLLYTKEHYDKWSFGQVMIQPSKMNLRRYYYELMITYLHININLNKNTEMIRKYGAKNIYRIIKGSLGMSMKYIKLMLNANG